jgi:hypothetical protein
MKMMMQQQLVRLVRLVRLASRQKDSPRQQQQHQDLAAILEAGRLLGVCWGLRSPNQQQKGLLQQVAVRGCCLPLAAAVCCLRRDTSAARRICG